MQPFIGDVDQLSEDNSDFRRVLFTGSHSQVVAMRLGPGEEIGLERHTVDQIFLLVEGEAVIELDGRRFDLEENELLLVPAGTEHTVTNTGEEDLALLTIYAPPQHAPGTVHHTRSDAMRAEMAEVAPLA
jgi:mannose-6-phosphate isomerase-like protein (cupin superfamily)